jgi:SAM-dependent methyltransferase
MLPADEANRQYFRESYRKREHGWETEEPSPYAVAFLQRVRRQVPAGTLLDIGCGEGRHCFAAWRLGFKVTGIDYEPLALERARHFAVVKHVDGIRFRKANVFSLPFPHSSFDVVLDYGCLHHQRKSDWTAYMASILRVLRPLGFYILSVFSPKFRLFRASRRPWHIAYGAYRRCFTPQEISALFGRYFEILAIAEEQGEGRGFWHVLMKRRTEGGTMPSTTRHNNRITK